jgi:predicted glycoside hydrolase/deacetylase ChbG (UPF0249 family)
LDVADKLMPAVICADDFALSEGVSASIVELARARRISATSVLTLSPLWPSQAQALREQRHSVDVGLHFDLTSEFALAAGFGGSLASILVKAMTHQFEFDQVLHWVRLQLDAFESVWRGPPAHVDGHQHVHQLPVVRKALMQELKKRYAASEDWLSQLDTHGASSATSPRLIKPWVRVSRVKPQSFKAQVISLCGASQLEQQLSEDGFGFTSLLVGSYGFNWNLAQYSKAFKGWLSLGAEHFRTAKSNSSGAFCVMCHPGGALDATDPIGQARQVEYEYLKSTQFAQDLLDAGVYLAKGSDILTTQPTPLMP